MLIKLSVIFFVVQFSTGQLENQDWELAVVANDRIQLLLSNGTLIGSAFNQFSTLKALTFDNVRHQFVVSDMDQQNDTIYSVQLTKETDVTPILEDLPDDVQGLAIDPITDTLYWTDSMNRTINYVHLNDSHYQSNILFAFTDENPQDIAIDVCRRFVYWTNSNMNRPTIERSRLDGSQREILVDSGLHRPAGISIDYKTQRLFWADIKEGIYFSIESTDLDGNGREVIIESTHTRPFGIAVDSDAIYWTDVNNNILWKLSKDQKEAAPQQLHKFSERPTGVVAKNVQITSFPDCKELSKAVDDYVGSVKEVFKHVSNVLELESEEVVCLNGGSLTAKNTCSCLRGYSGKFCELSLCYNYCVHGICSHSSLGFPQCHCLSGFTGKRCERDACDGFCLNDGNCSRQIGEYPACTCNGGFTGTRCEFSDDICDRYCAESPNGVLTTGREVLCRCVDGVKDWNISSSLPLFASLREAHTDFLDHFQDPAFLALICLVLILLVTVVIITTWSCSSRKHRRPRIKKRIIVNKNVTPLTYRPQSREQCEITIEDCCNMNICETPCFEPPLLPRLQKNDDKKKLLSNMENGEELY